MLLHSQKDTNNQLYEKSYNCQEQNICLYNKTQYVLHKNNLINCLK
jgi:hypothetical protein